MPANSSYSFTAGQILTAVDLNAVFAQTVAFAADSSNANTGTLLEVRLPYRMNQNVRSNSDVTFRNLTISGNLTVSGTTTFVNTSVLDIKDKNITLAKGSANSVLANTGGFTIEGANVTFQYDSTSNNMTLSHLLSIGNSTVNAVFGFDATSLSGGQFVGNINDYFQVIATNANTGIEASADFVAAEGDVASNNYINFGINNRNWSDATWTINGPYDGYLYTSTGNLAIGTADVKDIVFFANGTLSNNEAVRITSGGNVVVGNTKAGATVLSIGNTTVNTTINSSSFNINTVFTANSTVVNAVSYRINTNFIANTTGIYHTGTVNAASYTVSTAYRANSTGIYHTGTVNAASFTTTGTTSNTSGIYPASNSTGTALGNTISRWIINANTVNASGLITGLSGANIVGTANVSSDVNVGANVNITTTAINVGNATVNSTVNSTAINTTSMTVNALVVTSSITIGNSSTNTTSFDVGNSTITDTLITTDNLNVVNQTNTNNFYASSTANIASEVYANSSGLYVNDLVNTALFAVGSDFRANSSGAYTTGTVNAASLTTSGVTANTSGVYPASNSSGNALGNTISRWALLASTIGASGLVTAGAGLSVTGTANATVAVNVGANVNLSTSRINVGNSTVNSVVNSTAVTTTSLSSNSLTITSLITVGNSNINTTAFSVGNSSVVDTLVSAENLTISNVANTANLYVSTFANLASQAAVNTSGVYVLNGVNAASFTVGTNFVSNSAGVYSTGTVNAAVHSVGTATVANSLGVYTTGTVNAASHTTTGVTANVTGVYPASNTVGTDLGANDKRWSLLANTVGAQGLIYANGGINVTGTANVSQVLNVGANASIGANVVLTTSTIRVGNATVNVVANSSTVTINGTTVNSSFFPATANNANNLGGVAASNYMNRTANAEVTGLFTFGNTTQSANVTFANGVIVANGGFGLVNYVLSSNGTGMYWADLTVSAVNTLAQFTFTNTHTYGNTTQSANLVIANGALVFTSPSKLYANGSFGTNNQVLQSNGTAMYWGNGLVVYYANNTQAYP